MNNNIKYVSIPVLVSVILFAGLWITTHSATAEPDASYIAPPGPICRNGASGTSPEFDLAYASTGSGGMDLGFSVEFDPYPNNVPSSQGYADSIPTIRFKPKFDGNGNRLLTEYWLVTSEFDALSYPSSQLNPYLSENSNAPAPYTKGMGPIVRANLGRIWIVGNEVDRVQAQDSLMPETYARAYHDTYFYIKGIDPTAQIAVSGLVSFSPGRQHYLDLVVAEYQRIYGTNMPVDIWTMHAYNLWGRNFDSTVFDPNLGASIALGTNPLVEWQTNVKDGKADNARCKFDDVICIKEHDDVQLFQQQVLAMRQWMKDNGYKEKPLILTEWGLNLNSDLCDENNQRITAERAATFLTDTVNWMNSVTNHPLGYSLDEGRLVQRWAWYTIHQPISQLPALADISHLVADFKINYPSCNSADFPTKNFNPGQQNRLTVVGEAYKNVVAAQNINNPPTVDFVVDSVMNGTAVLPDGANTTQSTIGLMVRNVGNSPTGQNTTVEFRDASNNELIGSFTIPPNFQGCTTSLYRGTVKWTHSSRGSFNFNVEIKSPEETGTALDNNTTSGSASVVQYGAWLPAVMK